MFFLVIVVTCALLIISVLLLVNRVFFLRLSQAPLVQDPPFVSIMIPARDEVAVIGETVGRLLLSDYANFELLLLDDQSSDGTGEAARQAAQGDQRLTVLSGRPLPSGWSGKNWACHQMSQLAQGDIWLFTDADVRWQPSALHALVWQMERTQADLFTVWPTQTTNTWSERLVVPLMAVVILGYLPVIGTHYVPWAAFGAANGQCMAWRRAAYMQVGGHAAVADNVLEDVTLARMTKARRLRLRMADGGGLIGCRMYTDWRSVRNGYAKNILAGYGGLAPLILATIFHWLIFLFPWVWLFLGASWNGAAGWPVWPTALVMIGLLVRAITAAYTRQRVLDALGMPLSVLLMTVIALQAMYWHVAHGGPQWKGRTLSHKPHA